MAKTVALTVPIEAHGETLNALTFNEPTLAVLEDLELEIRDGGAKLKGEMITKAIAALAGIPPTSARQIALADLPAIGRELADFLPASLLTGDR
jgi:hypothetical protein